MKSARLFSILIAVSFLPLVANAQQGDALKIGDKTISREYFNARVNQLSQYYEKNGQKVGNDYQMVMEVRANAVRNLLIEEALLKQAVALKVPGADDPDINTAAGADKRQNVLNNTIPPLGKKLQEDQAAKIVADAKEAEVKLDSGVGFAEVAELFSQDEASRDDGGAIGEKTRDDLEPAVADLVFGINPGKYTKPVETEYGIQIFKVDARKHAEGKEFEQFKKDRISNVEQGEKPPTDDELKREYETVTLSMILFKKQDFNTLLNDWALKQVGAKDKDFAVLDPELNAYMELQVLTGNRNPRVQDIDKVLDTYKQLDAAQPDNPDIFFITGLLYEKKNSVSNENAASGADENDPYATTAPEAKTRSAEFLNDSLAAYQKSYELETKGGGAAKPDVIVSLGRIQLLMWESGGRSDEKLHAEALKNYTNAIPMSTEDLRQLFSIKDALMRLGADTKTLNDVKTKINAFITANKLESQVPLETIEGQ